MKWFCLTKHTHLYLALNSSNLNTSPVCPIDKYHLFQHRLWKDPSSKPLITSVSLPFFAQARHHAPLDMECKHIHWIFNTALFVPYTNKRDYLSIRPEPIPEETRLTFVRVLKHNGDCSPSMAFSHIHLVHTAGALDVVPYKLLLNVWNYVIITYGTARSVHQKNKWIPRHWRRH